ncbi:nucleotidyltransferase family protein [Candidatus Albibeggiatoa sp. nov. BB20]|uniref:nucleotidyltransferase family protein n=1 Tax=Candidatus Albibeggiatoa sp. nov. BB20 TaxID=3162723 RepID=UPI00336592F4
MNIVGILLAAGHGTRFGGDKLLHPLPNGEVIGLASARKLIPVFENNIAIVRESDTQLCEQLTQLDFQIITQTKLAGMGDNLALGVAACQDADGWVIALGDMPWVQVDTLHLIRRSLENGAFITAPSFNGQRGHPVGFNQCFRKQLTTLHGDSGARSLLKNHAEQLQLLPVNDAGILRDVDRKKDLTNF